MYSYNLIKPISVIFLIKVLFLTLALGPIKCHAQELILNETPPCIECEEFKSSFTKPGVTIISATNVEATDTILKGTTIVDTPATVPRHCDIRGLMLPDIGFAIKLPIHWNERFHMKGGGGYAGVIEHSGMEPWLVKGYATASTDAGHDGRAEPGATFAYNNRQKELDFAFRAIHETAVLAKEIIEVYYGKPPLYSYFYGSSTGGRQALMEAQRFPNDFDGILCEAPILNFSGIQMWGVWNAQALDGKGSITVEKLPLMEKAVYANCDGIDGLEDGLINDPRECTFDPAKDLPMCPGDVDGPDCFTIAQVEALKKIYGGVKNSQGELIFPGMTPGAEIVGIQALRYSPKPSSGWYEWIIGSPSRQLRYGSDFMKYLAFEVDDPGYDWRTYNFDTDPQKMAYISSILDATNPDLSKFKANGGKMITVHPWCDTAITPLQTVNYYESVLELMGKQTMDFYRLYMVPGTFHASQGAGCGIVDWFTPLANWVENGIVPEKIIASRVIDDKVVRTRPLYPYPNVARYKGSGDINDAVNFVCVEPE